MKTPKKVKKIKPKLSLWEGKLNSAGKNCCVDTFFAGAVGSLPKKLLSATYTQKGVVRYYTLNSIDRKVEAIDWLWENHYMKDAMIKISKSKSSRISSYKKALAYIYSMLL